MTGVIRHPLFQSYAKKSNQIFGVQSLQFGKQESAVLADQDAVEPDLPAAALGRLAEDEVPVYRRRVAVVRVVIAATRRKVDRTGDLFIEKNVADRLFDKGVQAERELADVARAFVRVEDLIRRLGVIRGRFDDLAVFEDEADVLEFQSVLDRGDVVMNDAVYAVFNGRGVDLAVRDVSFAFAFYRADSFDREGQIGVLRRQQTSK